MTPSQLKERGIGKLEGETDEAFIERMARKEADETAERLGYFVDRLGRPCIRLGEVEDIPVSKTDHRI